MTRYDQAHIEADSSLPIIRITRDFTATPGQLLRAHTDPEIFARWVGPNGGEVRVLADVDAEGLGRRVGVGDLELTGLGLRAERGLRVLRVDRHRAPHDELLDRVAG